MEDAGRIFKAQVLETGLSLFYVTCLTPLKDISLENQWTCQL